MIGRTIAHYRVEEKIGEGGMGEVYRAHDTKLNRDVALKILPQVFAQDAQRMARFEREAKVLASLNHSHIAQIHGLEETDGTKALVLELVEGETLAEQIARGPIPVDEALKIALQIAEGLEAAHEKGIIHRDLKPANIKITPEGEVKILDFGLAKALEEETPVSDPSHSPTLTQAATQAGVILGTAAYMSPEQARGKPVDKRADIWALGVVLFEMLTGEKVFGGEDVSEVMASVIQDEPDWKQLPAMHPGIERLLKRCLQKQPKSRLRDIGDARIEIEEAFEWPPGSKAEFPVAQRMSWRLSLVWAILGLVVGAAGTMVWMATYPALSPLPPLTRTIIGFPDRAPMDLKRNPLAISPDGSRLVYVAQIGDSTELYLRAMDQLEPIPISGTGGAYSPFFSPDGESVGFFDWNESKLKKVNLDGGVPVTLCDAPFGLGGSWGPEGSIIFTPDLTSTLWTISATGGAPRPLTERTLGESTHRWPEILPDGSAVLFTVWGGGSTARIMAFSLESNETKVLLEGGTYAHYSPTGHLIYVRHHDLFAAPFDAKRLEIEGTSVPILEDVGIDPSLGAAQYALSGDGSMAYVPFTPEASYRRLVWVDRQGVVEGVVGDWEEWGEYSFPRLSPDGKRLAVVRYGEKGKSDIWVSGLVGGTTARLTFEGNNTLPLWTPDGKRVAFASDRNGTSKLFWILADGSGSAEPLLESQYPQLPSSWSPDGKMLVFTQYHPSTGSDIWVLPMEGDSQAQPFLQSQFNEWAGVISPDGRWLAYNSDESGMDHIFVRPFPGPGAKWQVSTREGREPVWAPDGRELFYRDWRRVMAVPIETHPEFKAETPSTLIEGRYEVGEFHIFRNYDIKSDGKRFVMTQRGQQSTRQLNLVLNWFEELKRLFPTE